jgi:hypothetical protein
MQRIRDGGPVFILQLRGTKDEPRWMGMDGHVTASMTEAKRFEAVPAAGHGAFFVVEPPLPDDTWERWHPYFFSQRLAPGERDGPTHAPCDFFKTWKDLLRKHGLLVLALLLSLAWVHDAAAQLPVQEVGQNLIYNSIQSAEAVFQTAEWVLDLAPLEDYLFPEGAAEDLAQLSALVEEAEAVSFGVSSTQAQLESLFSLESAPTTSYELRQRVTEINQTLFNTYSYAMRTQSLLLTAMRTVEHILGFIEIVSGLEGKLSSQQLLAQQLGKLQQLHTEANIQRSAFERARSLEGVTPGVLYQGMQNIVDAMMEDHPRW